MAPTSPPPDVPPPSLDGILGGHATSSRTAGLHHTSSAAATAHATVPETAEDIEMDTMAAGHRRRRSSILNGFQGPATNASSSRSHRSHASRSIPLQDEPKISDGGLIPEEEGEREEGSTDGSFSDDDLQDDEEMGLTAKDRNRRKTKRRRNTLLDQRIAPDKVMSVEEKRQADQNVMRRISVNAGLIGLWYLFSLCISLVS